MQDVLKNLANIMLLDYCKEQRIDPSDSHVIKNGRGFAYSLVNNSDEKVFCTITFKKSAVPSYWWGMAAYGRKSEIAAALKLADGSYAPAVLIRDGADFFAWVFRNFETPCTEMQALRAARRTLEAGTQGYLNDNWQAYTNAAGTLEWLRDQEFTW